MHRNIRSLVVASAASLMLVAPAAVAAATPVQNGCPASAELVSVASLEAAGPYLLPGRIDDPANGGNGDGWVCAFALPDALIGPDGYTLYQFFENNLKAQGRP